MDKLCKFIDRELEDLENKVAASGKLSSAEVNYGKDLAKFKMALLTNDAMERDGYSSDYDGMVYETGTSYRGGRMSGARGRMNAKRDSRGRYSSEDGYSRADARENFMMELEELVEKAPDDHTRRKIEKFLADMK